MKHEAGSLLARLAARGADVTRISENGPPASKRPRPEPSSKAVAAARRPASSGLSALAGLLRAADEGAALQWLEGCTAAERKELGRLAGLELAWIDCDQAIGDNVADMSAMLIEELHQPYWFYQQALAADPTPSSVFHQQQATAPMSRSRGFWTARCGMRRHGWLPQDLPGCFDSVVHVVQAGSGTGVHIGDGLVLTCAHVVDSREDEPEGMPERLGRRKLLLFSSGRLFLAECCAVVESEDGAHDVAVLMLGSELELHDGCAAEGEGVEDLGCATLAPEPVQQDGRLFCIGNPSSVNLEDRSGDTEFEPPAWHVSVGSCQGYMDSSTHGQHVVQGGRGRAPTRGEMKATQGAAAVGAEAGVYLLHSCWTYWGHSGAPLFDEQGRVVGLHCAWDDRTGMRWGQKLQTLKIAVNQALQPVRPNSKDNVKQKAAKKKTTTRKKKRIN